MVRLPFRGVLCLAIVLALSAASYAQEFRGSITGTIVDPSGGVLPGVTVTVANTETAVSRWWFPTGRCVPGALLERGHLHRHLRTVGIPAAGPERTRSASANAALEVSLQPGGVTEKVEVTAERPVLTIGTGATGTVGRQANRGAAFDGTACMLPSHAARARHHSTTRTCFARRWTTATWRASSRTARRAATSSASTARRTCRTHAASAFLRRTPSRSSRCRPTRS